jgi:hypothetical protein
MLTQTNLRSKTRENNPRGDWAASDPRLGAVLIRNAAMSTYIDGVH